MKAVASLPIIAVETSSSGLHASHMTCRSAAGEPNDDNTYSNALPQD